MDTALVKKRKEEIIDAALQVFGEKGYHAAKIEDIAAVLGIGHGTFYRYFRNKLDIFNHVMEWILATIADLVKDVDPWKPETLDEYREQLEEIGDRMFDLFKKNPRITPILFYEAHGIDDAAVQERIREAFELIGRYTAMYFENGVAKGYLRKDLHIRETALAVNAALFEACRRVVSSDDPDRAISLWKETIISLLLDGVRER
jgi:AcrR family transcriptional regulator